MNENKETVAERREHVSRMRGMLQHCASSRQRRWLREAIQLASRNDRPTRS